MKHHLPDPAENTSSSTQPLDASSLLATARSDEEPGKCHLLITANTDSATGESTDGDPRPDLKYDEPANANIHALPIITVDDYSSVNAADIATTTRPVVKPDMPPISHTDPTESFAW